MRSSSGDYAPGLDHVRALAVLIIVVWHFLYGRFGEPWPVSGAEAWGPWVIFSQGEIGVALFVTLSGYLFARLLDGRRVLFRYLAWNRLLRLMPMYLLVIALAATLQAVTAGDLRVAYWYLLDLPEGMLSPTWQSREWAVLLPLFCYALLPVLMQMHRRSRSLLWGVVASAIVLRALYYARTGEVQDIAYWSLLGRIDQFVLGMIGYWMRGAIVGRHLVAAGVAAGYLALYGWFASAGGFYLLPGYPSPSPLWILLPALDGLALAALIGWYDGTFSARRGGLSAAVARIGEYSWSIYLLHFFLVFALARGIQLHWLDMTSIFVALPVALAAFAILVPLGYLATRFVERPFLRLRRPYLFPEGEPRERSAAAALSYL